MKRLLRRVSSRQTKETKNPLAKVIFGLLFVGISFWLLWTNEGRVNLAQVAEKGVQATAESINPALDGKLIMVSGRLTTEEVFDDGFFLRPGSYIEIQRTVEMYAWVEEEESDDDGSRITYQLEWTENPRSPSAFERPEGHENPELLTFSKTLAAARSRIGVYQVNTREIDLPPPQSLPLSIENVLEGPYRIGEQYLFEGTGSLKQPALGDVRVSFGVVPNGLQVTAVGRQDGDLIAPYNYDDKAALYRVLEGSRGQALEKLETEYKLMLWGMRALGIVLMWIGFGIMVSPLELLWRLIPVLGSVGRRAVAAITFLMALVIGGTTIIISAVAHNPWALLIILLAAVVVILFWQRSSARTA